MNAIYKDLKSKTFLVTGASSGIGQAIAIALGEQGANIILTGRNKARLQETADMIPTETLQLQADLVAEEERHALVEALPNLDGVCHAAGIINPFPIRYLDQAQFDKVFTINATAPILLTSRLLRKKKLNNHASIVFLSSVSSDRAMKGGATYTISKAAIEAYSRSVTLEHAAQGIRSNCLKPGLTKTQILNQAENLAIVSGSEKKMEMYKRKYLLGLGSTKDAANAALFLLSKESKWITGTEIVLDGGLSAQI